MGRRVYKSMLEILRVQGQDLKSSSQVFGAHWQSECESVTVVTPEIISDCFPQIRHFTSELTLYPVFFRFDMVCG